MVTEHKKLKKKKIKNTANSLLASIINRKVNVTELMHLLWLRNIESDNVTVFVYSMGRTKIIHKHICLWSDPLLWWNKNCLHGFVLACDRYCSHGARAAAEPLGDFSKTSCELDHQGPGRGHSCSPPTEGCPRGTPTRNSDSWWHHLLEGRLKSGCCRKRGGGIKQG